MNVDPEHHILNIKEEEYPEKYRPLIRRLQSAILEPEMRKQMKIEDGILDEFEDMQRKIQSQNHIIVESEQKAAKAEQKASKAAKNTAKAEQVANEARQETAQIKRDADEGKKAVVRNLKEAGVALSTIMQATGLSKEEIEYY